METQILKLDQPYEYIYCNGSIGLHIATMIVYETRRITMEQFYNFVNDMRQGEMPVPMEIAVSKMMLNQNNIEIEWPILRDEDGYMSQQEEFNISLEFKRNTESELYDYSCYDLGIGDIGPFTGAAPLYFFARFNTKEELKSHLINGMSSYYRMFRNHKFRIEYLWPEGSEFADVVDEVNQMEPEIRKDCNDIDV